jgi:hypothetical protein
MQKIIELMQVTDAKEKIPTVSQTFNIEKKRIGR